jgi:hypothetical protein
MLLQKMMMRLLLLQNKLLGLLLPKLMLLLLLLLLLSVIRVAGNCPNHQLEPGSGQAELSGICIFFPYPHASGCARTFGRSATGSTSNVGKHCRLSTRWTDM